MITGHPGHKAGVSVVAEGEVGGVCVERKTMRARLNLVVVGDRKGVWGKKGGGEKKGAGERRE